MFPPQIRLYGIVFIGNLLSLVGDATITWTSPILPKLYQNTTSNPLGRPITPTEDSWISSLLYIGCAIGMLPFALLADSIGRKSSLLLLAASHITAFTILSLAHEIWLFYLARILNGISMGSIYMILPLYVAEISSDANRGFFLMTICTSASLGALTSYVLGQYLPLVWFNAALAAICSVFAVLFFFVALESPYFYLKKGKEAKAQEAYTNLGHHYADALTKIKQETHDHDGGLTIWETLKTRYVIKAFLICLTVCVMQQLSGIVSILAYTQAIFQEAGFEEITPEESSILVGAVFFLASFIGLFLIDRKGRRFLLIVSVAGTIIPEVVLGTYFFLQDHGTMDLSRVSWIPLVCLMVFMVVFNVGLGPMPVILCSELLPGNVKFLLATVAQICLWMVSFLVTRFFLDFNRVLGRGGTFWLFSGCMVFLLVVTFLWVPETKGRSFHEIQTES